jgi:uncharacterized membrane protein YozB (DUF420 family)
MSTQADLTLGDIDKTSRDTRPTVRDRGAFYFGMAVAMSVIVFVGFGPTFYLNGYLAEAFGRPPLNALPPLIIVHGLVFTAWMILLMIQTGLVAQGQVRWHRRLGVAGAAVAALVVVLGTATNLASARRDLGTGAFDANPFIQVGIFAGFGSLIVFAALTGSAIYWRRRAETHKRLILLATIALLPAATGRVAAIIGFAVPALGPLPFLGLLLTDLFIVALLMHDWRTVKRLHPATLYGGLAVLGMQALNSSPLPGHPALHQLLRWLSG